MIIVGFQIILSQILAIQNSNHTQEHKYLRGKLFFFEGKSHGTNSKKFHYCQINYNNFCVCLTAKEKKSLLFFFALTHTNYLS